MADNENAIRALLENWARAISDGDRAAILAHHSPDFMIFRLSRVDHPRARSLSRQYEE